MPPVDRAAYQAALTAFYRRQALIGAGAAGVVLPTAWAATAGPQGGPGQRIAKAVGASAVMVSALDNYRRAEQRAGKDVSKEASRQRAKLAVRRAAPEDREQVAKAAFAQPDLRLPRHEQTAQLTTIGVYAAGWVQAGLDYRQRPGRRARSSGPSWRPRPGPAWWSGWSWQQLPVNATSTAPRAVQIAYERRQVLTLEACAAVGGAIAAWDAHLRPALAEGDGLRAGAALLRLTTGIARGVGRYRSVPHKVDAQRTRRDRHRQALDAATVAVAAGRRPPPNPWSREMALAALRTAITAGYLALLVTYIRSRPRVGDFRRAAPEPTHEDYLAGTGAASPADSDDDQHP